MRSAVKVSGKGNSGVDGDRSWPNTISEQDRATDNIIVSPEMYGKSYRLTAG